MHLIQNGIISEIKNSQNVCYILNDNNLFYLIGFKVLQSQGKNGFLKCAKLTYNGKIKLVYFTSGYKSFASLLPSMNADTLIAVIAKIINIIIDTKNNGFLRCNNIDISFDRIFLDSNTLTVQLIYLPVNDPGTNFSEAAFENELRTGFIKLINMTPSLRSPVIDRIKSELANGNTSLEALYKSIFTENKAGVSVENVATHAAVPTGVAPEDEQPLLIFTALNAPIRTVFNIKMPVFVIGKNESEVDGAITFNKAISRVHCKILFEKGSYHIVDLGSANGTYVNGKRIAPNQPMHITADDSVRLANTDFAVKV